MFWSFPRRSARKTKGSSGKRAPRPVLRRFQPSLELLERRELLTNGLGGISGTVFIDVNGDGQIGVVDAHWPSENDPVRIDLYQGETLYQVAQTDAQGNFFFTDLPPGTYQLVQEIPDGWAETVSVGSSVVVTADSTLTGQNFADTLP